MACVAKTELTIASNCPIQIGAYSYSELICFPNTGEINIVRVVGGNGTLSILP